MKCLGAPQEDRVCYLCQAVNNATYIKCLEEKRYREKVIQIAARCKYRQSRVEDYSQYYVCCKDGVTYDRTKEVSCNATFSCQKYSKQK